MTIIPDNVKAISFDIWKTLLEGNKSFTRPRLQLIFDELGIPIDDLTYADSVGIEAVRGAYLEADRLFNDKAEAEMQDYTLADRLNAMFLLLDIEADLPDKATLLAIQAKVGILRSQPENLPTLIEPDLIETLQTLKDRGYILGVLSNTGMDNILVMEPVLRELGLWDLFSVHVFSSEDGRAKPHPYLFRDMAKKLGVRVTEVLHIGDNVNADYRAIEAGLQALVYAPEGSTFPHITSMKELLVLRGQLVG